MKYMRLRRRRTARVVPPNSAPQAIVSNWARRRLARILARRTAAAAVPPSPVVPASGAGKYKQERIDLSGFPGGRVGRVTLVRRNGRVFLRWYEQGRNCWEPVRCPEGTDPLPAAITRASEIDQRLVGRPKTLGPWKQVTLRQAVEEYLKFKEAGSVTASSIRKYRALLARAVAFAEGTPEGGRCRHLAEIDSDYCLGFGTWLGAQTVTGNGSPASDTNPSRILSASEQHEAKARLRGLFEYALRNSPPLVPPNWRNPLTSELIGRRPPKGTRELSEPPVSLTDLRTIVFFLDAYGLALLAPLFLYGPRPSELGHILRADFDAKENFLQIVCRPEAGYTTKGRQPKHLPVTPALLSCMRPLLDRAAGGPIFVKRAVFEGKAPPLAGADAERLAAELVRRKQEFAAKAGRPASKAEAEKIATDCWQDAGAVDGRDVERELARAAERAKLERIPTPRDIRHLFETLCEEGMLSPGVIRHLMGHSPPRGDALFHYSHTSRQTLRDQVALVDQKRDSLISALAQEAHDLSLTGEEWIREFELNARAQPAADRSQ